MTEVYQGVKVRIYPNQNQIKQIETNFNHVRFIYNQLINWNNQRYQNGEKFPGKYDFSKKVVGLKHEHPWLKDAESTCLVNTAFNLYDAYKRMFKHLGRKPRFKSRFNQQQSYTSNNVVNKKANTNSVAILGQRVKIPKLGTVRFKGDTDTLQNTVIKAVTISRNSAKQYFATFRVVNDKSELVKTNRKVGLDMGIAALCITSDGQKYQTTQYEAQLERQLFLWQRKLARRRIGAKKQAQIDKHQAKQVAKQTGTEPNYLQWYEHPNYQKARVQVAKYRMKIANQRKMDIQKITTDIVRRYDVIKMEDLNVNGMLKNHHLARAISNQGWRMFRTMLEYKCNWYGKQLIIVNPAKTSQICSNCGYDDGNHGCKNGFEGLKIRQWTCPQCHVHHDRDINAAINILNAESKE